MYNNEEHMEMYRSGHNENDSKSFGRTNAARGFESHRLRHIVKGAFEIRLFVFHTPGFCTPKEIECLYLRISKGQAAKESSQ